MNLTRFEPWSIVDLLHRDLDRLAARRIPAGDSEAPVADWVPAVDIIEENERFVLRADVPGVDPADIEVSMDAGVLSIAGQRARESQRGCRAAAHGARQRPFLPPLLAPGYRRCREYQGTLQERHPGSFDSQGAGGAGAPHPGRSGLRLLPRGRDKWARPRIIRKGACRN